MGAMTRVMERIGGATDRLALAEPEALGIAPFPIPVPVLPRRNATPVAPEPEIKDDEPSDVDRADTTSTRTAARPADATTTLRIERVDRAVVTVHAPQSPVCEQYRSLRARLITHPSAAAPRVLAVTSTIPKEGKSVSAVNLAIVLSEGGDRRVVLVDADVRRGSVRKMLDLDEGPGFADVVLDRAALPEVLRNTHRPNLKVITAGAAGAADFGGLLNRPTVRRALAQLREQFDDVILDTPPVATVSDTCTIAPHCEGLVLVVEAGRTPEPLVQETVRALNATGTEIIGCVLSRGRSERRHEYDSYYDYYTRG